MSILKTGVIKTNTDTAHYLVNNFTESNTTTGWTLTDWTLSNGVLIGTGTGPSFSSSSFSVGANDAVCVEFTVSLPTVSSTTSNPGIYIGTQSDQSVYLNEYDFSTNSWNIATSTTSNAYFLNAYNSTAQNHVITYVFGSGVSSDVMNLFGAYRTNTDYDVYSIKLSSGLTSTNLRSGYGTNSSMVINLSKVRVYNVLYCGMNESSGSLGKIGKGYCLANGLIED